MSGETRAAELGLEILVPTPAIHSVVARDARQDPGREKPRRNRKDENNEDAFSEEASGAGDHQLDHLA